MFRRLPLPLQGHPPASRQGSPFRTPWRVERLLRWREKSFLMSRSCPPSLAAVRKLRRGDEEELFPVGDEGRSPEEWIAMVLPISGGRKEHPKLPFVFVS